MLSMLRKRRDEAAAFTRVVEEWGQALRLLSYDQLTRLTDEPSRNVVFGKREGRVALIVEPCDGDRVRVVVQGFLSAFVWLPAIKGVRLHGFYKHKDGTISEMEDEEFNRYD